MQEEVEFNSKFNYWRVRVEHIIGMIKKHDMFCGVYRGTYALLKACLDITVHVTNIKIRFSLPRYDTTGPWGHLPGSAPQ